MLDATKRQSNIEALRIIAFTMVVSIHVSASGVGYFPTDTLNWAFANMVDGASRTAIGLFILIAAYFLSTKESTPSYIARRWFQIIYPVLIMILIICIYSPPENFPEITNIFVQLLQGNFRSYHRIPNSHLWFVYPFILMVALSPVMNHAIKSMDRKTYQKALAILLITLIIPQSIEDFTANNIFYNVNDNLFYFIALYFIAGYIRKFDFQISFSKAISVWFITTALVIGLCYTYTNILHVSDPSYAYDAYIRFYDNNNILVVTGATFLFLAFRQVRFSNRFVSLCGKATFDAYLIQYFILFMIMKEWPIKYAGNTDIVGYSIQAFSIIGIAVVLSLGYGILRYYFDKGATRVIKYSKLDIKSHIAFNHIVKKTQMIYSRGKMNE